MPVGKNILICSAIGCCVAYRQSISIVALQGADGQKVKPSADGKALCSGVANRKRKPDHLYEHGGFWQGGRDESQPNCFGNDSDKTALKPLITRNTPAITLPFQPGQGSMILSNDPTVPPLAATEMLRCGRGTEFRFWFILMVGARNEKLRSATG
jgi:hypothetical protein